MNKSHIEHSVCLIQHEMADGMQADVTLVNKVEQTARCGNQDVYAVLQRTYLCMLFHSAIDHAMPDAGVSGVLPKTVVDLDGQFTGRRKDQSFDLSSFSMAFILIELLNDGECKGGGLSGAGLCQSQYVTVFQCREDGLFLYGCGCGVSFFIERL